MKDNLFAILMVITILCALAGFAKALFKSWQAVGVQPPKPKRSLFRTLFPTRRDRELTRYGGLLQKRFANVGEGVHEDSIAKQSDLVITTRYLLAKSGSAATHIDLCGTADVPLGVISDEVDAIGDYVNIQLLGKGCTKRMVASGAISAFALVYVGALGKVASSGTQIIGVSLTAATNDGDVIEVVDGPPLSATPGVAASLYDAHTILYATTDNTPAALTVGASTFVGRKATGNISAMSYTEALTELGNNSAPTGSGKVVLQTSPTLVTPVLGVASGTSLAASGAITSSSASAGIGYATGAGAAVTQLTNRSTGVTINAVSGAITTDATSLAAGAEAEFTVTNSAVAIGDVVVLSLRSGATPNTSIPFVTAVAAGSFKITLSNVHASTADTGASVINFAVIKAVSA